MTAQSPVEIRKTQELGLLAFMASVTMLFAAVTAAYLIRRTGTDWQRAPVPSILWLSTALVLAGSATIEAAHRRGSRAWLGLTTLLGLGFLLMQTLSWLELLGTGVFSPHHAHSSFFYLLTGVHGLHLTGGVVALLLALRKAGGPGLVRLYWHFMGGLWVYAFALWALL